MCQTAQLDFAFGIGPRAQRSHVRRTIRRGPRLCPFALSRGRPIEDRLEDRHVGSALDDRPKAEGAIRRVHLADERAARPVDLLQPDARVQAINQTVVQPSPAYRVDSGGFASTQTTRCPILNAMICSLDLNVQRPCACTDVYWTFVGHERYLMQDRLLRFRRNLLR